MALGTIYGFNDVTKQLGDGSYTLASDTLAFYFITETASAINLDATNPVLANFTQVASGGNYTGSFAGASVTWTRSTVTSKYDAADLSLLKDASNPSTVKTLIAVDTTATNKVFCAWDMTTDNGVTAPDLVNNDFTFTVNANGLFQVAKV